jgi:hypothetical protein
VRAPLLCICISPLHQKKNKKHKTLPPGEKKKHLKFVTARDENVPRFVVCIDTPRLKSVSKVVICERKAVA